MLNFKGFKIYAICVYRIVFLKRALSRTSLQKTIYRGKMNLSNNYYY